MNIAFRTIEERIELWSVSEEPTGTGGSSFETTELGVLAASDRAAGRRVRCVCPDTALPDLALSLRLLTELARELANLDNFDCGFAGTDGACMAGLLDFDWKSGMSGIPSMAGRVSMDCLGVAELSCATDEGLENDPSYLDRR